MNKKGIKNHVWLLVAALVITTGMTLSKGARDNTDVQASDADVLDGLYSELFTTEGRYEIKADIAEEKVKQAQDMFSLLYSEQMDESDTWTQVILDVQFANQEKAKSAVQEVRTETDRIVKEELFSTVYELLAKPFNEEFKQNLLEAVNKEYGEMMDVNPTAGTISIDGIVKPFLSMGDKVNTQEIQRHIDNGHIASSLTEFSGIDGESTYFGGHNPGVFEFMYDYMSHGAIVTVTDSNGKSYDYVMIDSVNTDIQGEPIMSYTKQSALDMYQNGTGEESIIIQFCNPDPTIMHFWYGVKR